MSIKAYLGVGFYRTGVALKNIAQSQHVFASHPVRGDLYAYRRIVQPAAFGHQQQALAQELEFTRGFFSFIVKVAVIARLFIQTGSQAQGLLRVQQLAYLCIAARKKSNLGMSGKVLDSCKRPCFW